MSQLQDTLVTRDASKRFDMGAFAARRLKIILALGVFLFLCLLPVSFFTSKAYYETSGKILLAREMPQITGRSDEFNIANYFHDYARTQVERIRSAITLEAALESLPEDERKVFQPRDVSTIVAVSRLQKALAVSQIPNTHVIQIQIQGDRPRGLAALVNAVMDTYMRRLRHEEENKDTRRLEFLTLERDALAKDIAQWTARVSDIVQATKTSPDQDQSDIFLHRVMQLQDAYLRAYNERVQAENAFKQAQVEARQVRDVSIKVLADEVVAGDQSLWRTASWTYEKLQELRASIDGIAKGNPDRQYIEKRMEAMQDYEQKQRRDVKEHAEVLVTEKREYELTRRLITVENAFKVKEQTANDLKAQLDASLVDLETNSLRMLQGKELLRNIENSKKKYFEIEGRIRDLQLDAKAPLRVSIESYAIDPESAAGSNLRKMVMMLFMVSVGVVAMAFFVYDFTDSRVRGPKDIQNLMGRPPAWPISAYPVEPDRPERFASVSLDDPQSREAKAIRSLAVRLDKERTENNSRVALISGVHEGAGVTSLLLNAAHSMRNFCEKVLVVDGNAFRPNVLGLAGLKPVEGVLERALSCPADLESCLARDEARGLDILALGRGPWSQEHFRQLPGLLDNLKRSYDFIFIDSAPVMDSDLTEALAVRSDICVLVIQGDRTLYPDLARTVEIFLRLEVPALATALNWGGPKPVTRLGKFAERLPWPWVARLLAKGSKFSARAVLVLLCVGAGFLAAEAGRALMADWARGPDEMAVAPARPGGKSSLSAPEGSATSVAPDATATVAPPDSAGAQSPGEGQARLEAAPEGGSGAPPADTKPTKPASGDAVAPDARAERAAIRRVAARDVSPRPAAASPVRPKVGAASNPRGSGAQNAEKRGGDRVAVSFRQAGP